VGDLPVADQTIEPMDGWANVVRCFGVAEEGGGKIHGFVIPHGLTLVNDMRT
jgi:hypothetical protein